MNYRAPVAALAVFGLFSASIAFAGPDAGVVVAPVVSTPKPSVTSTRTAQVTPAIVASPEDLELARHLEVLENLDLLENWELLSVMPALEEDDE